MPQNSNRLYLTDAELALSIEKMYFAYRAFTKEADSILEEHEYGRAHHRVLHFVGTREGLSVGDLLTILQITKQSLSRIMKQLTKDKMIELQKDSYDKRIKQLYLSAKGKQLFVKLFDAQKKRISEVFREKKSESVNGFLSVLEALAFDKNTSEKFNI
jgi:DNA-binding MarR family transcriptional regulator